MEKMNKAGYTNTWKYYTGQVEYDSKDQDMSVNSHPSWSGQYGNITYHQLGLIVNITDIVTEENTEVVFQNKALEVKREKLNLNGTITKMIQENFCFVIDMKKYIPASKIQDLAWVNFGLMFKETNVSLLKLDIEDTHQIYYNNRNFDLQGDKLFFEANNNFWKIYKIKLTVYDKLADDTSPECSNYDNLNSYEDCMKKEAQKIFVPMIGCVPPMIETEQAEHENKTCKGNKKDILDSMVCLLYTSPSPRDS